MFPPHSSYPCRIQAPTSPPPSVLREQPSLSVLETPQRGIWILNKMLAGGWQVGPVAACFQHDEMRIPLHSSAGHSPLTRRFNLTNRLSCNTGVYRGQCAHQFWMLPTGGDDTVLTDVAGLFHALHCLRRAWATPVVSAA